MDQNPQPQTEVSPLVPPPIGETPILVTPPVPPDPINKKISRGTLFLISALGVLMLTLVVIAINVFQARNAISPAIPTPMPKSVIKIAVNPWQASEINATIIKIILEEEMGYPVELVAIDENSQWESLSSGAIHTSLEIWPSGHKENIKKFIEENKSVENGGELGPVGKIGWFIPKYLLTDHPSLTTWEGLKDPKIATLFASPSGKGQFFTGDATWTQYDEQIIKNLNLNFEVKVLGSEENLIEEVDTAYKAKKPLLFYFWTPHWAHSLYDLVPVKLPEYTDACYENLDTGVNCDYPSDQLFKIYWSGFKQYAPDAYEFLNNFNYTNQDQIGMLAAVQLEKKTVEEVARIWVKNNESVWKPWLPK